MGYESKLFIVHKNANTNYDKKKKQYADFIVSIDLSKCYSFSDWMRKRKEADCYIYMDDGNTQILEDKYGKPLTEASVEDVLEHLKKAEKIDSYRRYRLAIDIMQSFVDHKEDWGGGLAVLHYGY